MVQPPEELPVEPKPPREAVELDELEELGVDDRKLLELEVLLGLELELLLALEVVELELLDGDDVKPTDVELLGRRPEVAPQRRRSL